MPESDSAERLAEQIERMRAAASRPISEPESEPDVDPLVFRISTHDLRDGHRIDLTTSSIYGKDISPLRVAQCIFCYEKWTISPEQLQTLRVDLRYCVCVSVSSVQPYITVRGSTLLKTTMRCRTCHREIHPEDYLVSFDSVSQIIIKLVSDAVKGARILKIKRG